MRITKWPDISQVGVVKDVRDIDLPLNAWTDARYARFTDGAIERMQGHDETLAGCPIAPYWAMHCFDSALQSHWLVAGLGKVYDFAGVTWTDISKAATTYNATPTDIWNGGVLGNIPVVNNGVEVPQMWAPVSSGQLLVDLSSWPATHRAKVIRPFKEFLFALDVTESGTRFQHRVLVSHPAAPGAVPSSWDASDATKDVYTKDLTDFGQGRLLDCLGMRDVNILYKERSAWGMQFIGGKDKWRLFNIFDEVGLLDTHCVVAFANSSQHFLATGDDVVFHNGSSPTSILTKRMRRWLQRNLDPTNYRLSFSVHNQQQTECWFCFAMIGATKVNMALVWNYRYNTVGLRPLDSYSFIASGQIPTNVSDSWDGGTPGSWDSDFTSWDTFTHPPFIRRLLGVRPTGQLLHHIDFTEQASGADYEAYVERTGLDAIGADNQGEPIRDRALNRLIKRIYIRAEGSPFEVWIATQEIAGGSFTWVNEGTFTPGTDEFIDVEKSTRLWGIRFRSLGGGTWKINSFEPDIEPLGQF